MKNRSKRIEDRAEIITMRKARTRIKKLRKTAQKKSIFGTGVPNADLWVKRDEGWKNKANDNKAKPQIKVKQLNPTPVVKSTYFEKTEDKRSKTTALVSSDNSQEDSKPLQRSDAQKSPLLSSKAHEDTEDYYDYSEDDFEEYEEDEDELYSDHSNDPDVFTQDSFEEADLFALELTNLTEVDRELIKNDECLDEWGNWKWALSDREQADLEVEDYRSEKERCFNESLEGWCKDRLMEGE